MGLSASALLTGITKSEQNKETLLNTQDQNIQKINQKNMEVAQLFSRIQSEQFAVDGFEQELEMLDATENPLNQLYCGIKEFVVTEAGMCGMGMGMGQFEVNNCIKLTGKELVAMDQVLNGNSQGEFSPEELVQQLNSLGIDNAELSESGESIELTRVDEEGNEQKIKFCDANGDGMLNGCDYDFSDALCKFNQDLEEFTAKVDSIEGLQEAAESRIEQAEATADKTEEEINTIEKENDKISEEIDSEDENITNIKSTLDDVETKEKKKEEEKQAA